jgi:type III secretion protein J
MRRLRVLLVVAAAVAGCRAEIRHGLEEPAANEVVTALERAGVGADKLRDEGAEGKFVVRVAQSDVVRALDLLGAVGLPRDRRSGFAEVYAQPSLVPTATEERARYIQALAGEIERTLETVEGVVGARVHLVMAEADPLANDGKPRVPAQAAVLLKARLGPAPIKEADVQRLVAGSVPGLQAASVAVVITAAGDGSATATPALTALGPLRVAPGTRPMLLLGGALALTLLAVLAALLLFTARRLAAIQQRLERG